MSQRWYKMTITSSCFWKSFKLRTCTTFYINYKLMIYIGLQHGPVCSHYDRGWHISLNIKYLDTIICYTFVTQRTADQWLTAKVIQSSIQNMVILSTRTHPQTHILPEKFNLVLRTCTSENGEENQYYRMRVWIHCEV